MSDQPAPASLTHPAKSHFDQRSATYDQAEIHHRVVAILAAGAAVEPGLRVLDVATGTGLLAFEAAKRVGPAGSVLGVDISGGMLAEANRKAEGTGLRNIRFSLGDAERLDLPQSSFDRIVAASALVLMSDIPRALRHWSSFLKPGGMVAFDVPGEPFGLSGRIAEIASAHGIRLGYADVANTPAKCRALLEGAGLDVVAVTTELANTAPVGLGQAIAFLDEHMDHPAWQALKEAPPATREAVRSAYIGSIMAAAVGGQVPNDTALNFAFGRKPS
jgi:ubiquinone/menaquinone biosynthesis C-methylase UbiE